jgi:hypothetical protein
MLREIALAQRRSRRIWADVAKIIPRLAANKRVAGTAEAEKTPPSKRQKVAHC